MHTWDSNQLTLLVLLAHEMCVRVEVKPCNMQYLKLCFSPRDCRDGDIYKRHPTIEQAAASLREYIGVGDSDGD
jgi:hypothetical protein